MNAYEIRNHLDLQTWNTEITRAEYEAHFHKTKEKVIFTFAGWDGKSYDGESRSAVVYRTDIEGFENFKFVKVGKHLHFINENHSVVEKATGESHHTACWIVDVQRA